jgi:arylsulfatase A-like enzyme
VPNLLLLHCHDLGRFLGCYGVPTVATPNLDRLAAEGTRFDQAFCAAPQCSPARGSLFTGRYPQQHGVMGLTHSYFGWDLRPEVPHLAALLGAGGYGSTLLGVHHESRVRADADIAARLGFDEVVTGGDAATVAGRAVDRLGRYAESRQPFYLQVGFHEPHRDPGDRDAPGTMGFLGNHLQPDDSNGVTVPPHLVDDAGSRAEIAELQGAVAAMDAGAGTVLQALRDLRLDDDTVVVFTTDHGLALPRAKCTLYDPGIGVSLIIRIPGRDAAVVDDLVSHVDIVPTLLELTGQPVPPDLPGRSLLPRLTGDRGQVRTEVFAQLSHHDYYDPRRCVRTANHKLIVNFSSAPDIMDCSQSWRPRSMPRGLAGSVPPYHAPVELYDLRADPLELRNLADDPTQQAVRADLLQRLADWMRAVEDPLLDGPVVAPMQRTATALLPG